jgi:hypothetical protein
VLSPGGTTLLPQYTLFFLFGFDPVIDLMIVSAIFRTCGLLNADLSSAALSYMYYLANSAASAN